MTKLFHIVQPTRAYFGQKDAAQSVMITRLVQDLNMEVEVVVLPTIRDPDHLAMSSRNAYLNDEWILMEYDYKTKKLIHNFEDGKVIPGNNTIKIVVTDKLDNTATFTSNFIY